MYVLIDPRQLEGTPLAHTFHEMTADGRAILPLSALRTLGTVTGVDIVATAAEVKRLASQTSDESTSGQENEATSQQEFPSFPESSSLKN